MSEWFKHLDGLSNDKRERNDCVVKALATARGISYQQAHTQCKRNGRRTGCGMYEAKWLPMFKRSCKLEQSKYLGGFKTTTTLVRKLDQTAERDAQAGIGYLIKTSSHVSVYWNGQLHDWMRNNSRKRVKGVWLIHNMDEV